MISKIRQAGNFGFSENRETTLQGLNSKLSEYAAIALATLDVFLKNSLEETNLSMVFRRIRENVVFRTRMEGTKTEGGIVSQFMPLLCPSSQSNITF